MTLKQFRSYCLQKARSVMWKLDALSDQHTVHVRVKKIGGGYHGSNTEWREVKQYWKRFGIRPKRVWYDLYCDGLGAYDPRFIPDPIWTYEILPYFNSVYLFRAYTDKGIYNRLITGVKQPETVVKRMAEYYYNGDCEQLISREEAENLCMNEDHLIFKPSEGKKGEGILFYDKDDKDSMTVPAIMDSIKGGFVAQRIIKQHADLARLNPSTLNTIRVISFHFKDQVYILSAQLRIGGTNSRVDNYSAGGNAVAVKPDGWVYEKSVNHDMEWVDTTPGGIKLSEVRVPNYQEITETIKHLHCQLPYFNIVGWDFAVGEDGTPVMIEFNIKPGQNQIGGKEPSFGDLTDEVLEEVFIRKNHSHKR